LPLEVGTIAAPLASSARAKSNQINRNSSNSNSVKTIETAIEPRQPSLFEKKTNMTVPCNRNAGGRVLLV
jgi:hypothetical protein